MLAGGGYTGQVSKNRCMKFILNVCGDGSRVFGGASLYGAVLIGSLLQGNALSAAADNAAAFVSLAIQGTPYTQDTRFGVWFETLLPRLCPLREEPEGIL